MYPKESIPTSKFPIIAKIKHIVQTEGLTYLWKGNVANLVRYVPVQALNFSLKDLFEQKVKKAYLEKVNTTYSDFYKLLFSNFLSGGIAGISSITFVYPIDRSRVVVLADMGRSKRNIQGNSLIDGLKHILKTEGLSGLYKGLSSNFPGIFVYRALYFGLYDTTKIYFSPGVLASFGLGLCASFSASFISTPFENVRRRLLTRMLNNQGNHINYTSYIDCCTKIIRNEGFKSLFRGSLSTGIRSSAGGAFALVMFDQLQKAFGVA
ncbi:hypothetical protein ABK040_004880 [Willaertia magna]